ncbi:hypothetical protein ACFE04_024110 [Oxalis oulophora]
MGSWLLFEFSFKCFCFVAWPYLSLLYPLFASIKAIETKSNYHTKRLVTYWISFSLISLFEHVFLYQLLQRIPVWSFIKLLIVCWLVIPNFNGSVSVYKHIVQPCLSFLPCNAINWLVCQTEKRDKLHASEDDESKAAAAAEHRDMVESILIFQCSWMFPCLMMNRNDRGVEPEIRIETINDQQNVAMQQDNKILKVTEKIEATKAKQEILETTTSASTESCRGGPPPITPPAAIKTVQRKWPCAICQVTTTSETTLNSHFKGKLHKAACEKLRRTTRASKDKVVRSWRCAICNVNCTGEYDLYCHLIGRKHISMSQA